MSGSPRPSQFPSARELAFHVLQRVEEGGAYASLLLDHHQDQLGDPRESSLARELVLGALRRRAVLDHVLATVASRPLERIDPPVRSALRIGAYEILFLDRIPDFASVDSAVDLLKKHGLRSAAGFANGVLRSVARTGREHLPSEPKRGDLAGLALYHSHPRWWVERLVERRGWEAAGRELAANNTPAATVLRSNLRKTSAPQLARRLAADGVVTEACLRVPDALRVRSGIARQTEAFRDGHAWIQDEASQLIPRLFGGSPGPRVADLCAAPGGKSFQLAERLPEGGYVLACDRHLGRLRRMRSNLERLGISGILIVAADMSAPRPALRGPFDHVLVDAPCTGTGTLRRHPEIRWRLKPGDPARMAEVQSRILDTAASLVAPEGSLVYAVCSQEPEEGEEVVKAFLKRHPAFAVADPREHVPEPARDLIREDHTLRTLPGEGELDGFFAALFLRKQASDG